MKKTVSTENYGTNFLAILSTAVCRLYRGLRKCVERGARYLHDTKDAEKNVPCVPIPSYGVSVNHPPSGLTKN